MDKLKARKGFSLATSGLSVEAKKRRGIFLEDYSKRNTHGLKGKRKAATKAAA